MSSNVQTDHRICKNQKEVVIQARKQATKLKHEKYVTTIAQFDLPKSTYQIIKNQPRAIKKMLKHNRICSDLIERNGGVVIKELGDAVLARFPSITNACTCAINVICNLKKFGNDICTKVTITYGSIMEVITRKEPDVYGRAVNLCNRMSRWAKNDTILLEKNNLKELERYMPKDNTVKISKPFERNLKEFKKMKLCKISLEC
jgi:class 3 adenylate cyclase